LVVKINGFGCKNYLVSTDLTNQSMQIIGFACKPAYS